MRFNQPHNQANYRVKIREFPSRIILLFVQSPILNNVALAYQNLGYWQEAETAITNSLEILNDLNTNTQTYTEILAKALNTQGYLQWLEGNFSEAIATWDLAAGNYLTAGDTENALKCQLNQIKALQAVGLSSKAKELLEQIDRDLDKTANSRLKVIGLRHLGNVLRQVGDLQQSETILNSSLSITDFPDTLLELGNTEKALSDNYLTTNQPKLADQYAQAASSHYQKAFNQGNNLKAGLNQLSLAITTGTWSDIASLITQVNHSLESLPFTRAGIYARLNFARSLRCLKEIEEDNNLTCVSKVRQDKLKQLLAQQQPNIQTSSWEKIASDIETLLTVRLNQK